MRIVHLSDIHFSARNIDSFEQYYIEAICSDLKAFNQERKIDAICLTGDLVDRGGNSFGTPQAAYEIFLNNFWNPIARKVGLDSCILFMIPGNHDVNEAVIDEYYEIGMVGKLTSIQAIDDFVNKRYGSNSTGLERQEDFKKFERSFYQNNSTSEITNFESYHTLSLPEGLVGFACINTSWRCSTALPANSLVLGTTQLRKAAKHLKDKGCKYIIGLMHHPLDFISDIERDEASSMLQNLGYNAVLFGHTHHGKTSFLENNSGDLFISTARTGFSNPAQEIEKYKSGYTILDFNFGDSRVYCHYRRYIHTRIEFDKDTELAKDGSRSFPIKSAGGVVSGSALNSLVDTVTSTDITEGTHDSTVVGLSQDDNTMEKAMKLFLQERDKLTYNSSDEEFAFVKQLERELIGQITLPLNDKVKNIPALQDKFVESVFKDVYASDLLSGALISDVQLIRDDKQVYSWYERKVIINAITL